MIKYVFEKDVKRSVAYDDEKEIGECDYLEIEDTWNIIHTGVSSKYQGQGIARKLVELVLEKAAENNKKVIAECSYALKVIESKK